MAIEAPKITAENCKRKCKTKQVQESKVIPHIIIIHTYSTQ